MGFWDNDEVSVVSRRSHDGKTKYSVERNKKSRSRSRSRSRAPTRGASSIFGGGGGKHSSSRSSFFSLPVGSRSSFFGLGKCLIFLRSYHHPLLGSFRTSAVQLSPGSPTMRHHPLPFSQLKRNKKLTLVKKAAAPPPTTAAPPAKTSSPAPGRS